MIYNFDNHLKYFTLESKINNTAVTYDNENNLKISSMILKELSKSLLSLSLYYLDLKLAINPNDLQTFFENCKQVELKKLLIRNRSNENVDTTLKVIKDFVKEKNIEFLAYNIIKLPTKDDVCHKNLENLVEEIQSFTKMVKYDDLIIRVSEVDGNLSNS